MAGRPIEPPTLAQDASGTWQIKFNDGTRQRFKSTYTKVLAEAQKVFGRWLAGDVEPSEPQRVTVREIVSYYVRYRVPHVVDSVTVKNRMEWIAKGLGDETFISLSKESTIRNYVKRRMVGGDLHGTVSGGRAYAAKSTNTPRGELVMLRTAIRFWLKEHPEHREREPAIWLPASVRPDKRAPADAQYQSLLDAASRKRRGRTSRLYRYLILARFSAQRRRSIELLTWSQIALDDGLIDFRTPGKPLTKKRQADSYTMPGELVALLREWHDERLPAKPGKDFVLDHGGSIYLEFKRLCRRCGFGWITPHLLRHMTLTRGVEAGISTFMLGEAFAVTPTTIERNYAHPSKHLVADVQAKTAPKIRRAT